MKTLTLKTNLTKIALLGALTAAPVLALTNSAQAAPSHRQAAPIVKYNKPFPNWNNGNKDQRFDNTRFDPRINQGRDDKRNNAPRFDDHRNDNRFDSRRNDDKNRGKSNDTGKIIGAGIVGAILGAVLSH